MAVFAWIPTYGSALAIKPEVLVIPPDQFGSDAERRIQIGTQHVRRVWSLTFENRPSATADAIEAFLAAREGLEAFDWVPPHGEGGQVGVPRMEQHPYQPYHPQREHVLRGSLRSLTRVRIWRHQ